jgi:hypothetical protein
LSSGDRKSVTTVAFRISAEQVLDADRHTVADTGTVGVRPGFLDASGIEVHSHPSRPEFRPA